MRNSSVVYPPVAEAFTPLPPAERERARRAVAPLGGALLVNVKRLHPLADHATLLEAFARVRARRGDAVLAIAGSGEQEGALRAQAARLGLGPSLRLLGLVPNEDLARLVAAADLFVLSSVLEATPTVALEALACGTPVVSTDNPGGVELNRLFGEDVAVTPRGRPEDLAGAVLAFLDAPRRTSAATAARVAAGFRLDGVVRRYLELYEEARAA
jgi:glycosyltransferase involved in cell wall biosynthesis